MTVEHSTVDADVTLLRNPFHVLGATTRDGRSRIVELAEERSLVADEDACRDAQNALINLRGRLSAEMGWFPGVSPRKAAEMANGVVASALPEAVGELPPLARANAMAAYLESLPPRSDPAKAGPVIMRLAAAVEEVDPDEVLRDINEDRSVAGYQPVRDAGLVIEEFEACKRAYRNAVRDFADRLPSQTLVKLVDRLVELGTEGGKRHAPAVIQDVVDLYETAAQGFVERECSNVLTLIGRAKDAIAHGEARVALIFADVERAALNFNAVLRPVQTVSHANGTDHRPSLEIAFAIRGLAITLHNEHGWHELPARITSFLEQNFPRLSEFRDAVAGDADYLRQAAEQRRKAEEETQEFESSMNYTAAVGRLFKDTVAISIQAIEWQNKRFPLDAITRIRWGGTRHSVNGIPTGTTHMILVGDAANAMTITMRDQTVFSNLTDRLWKTVGVRLMVENLRRLRDGGTIPLPGGAIRDDGALLTRRKFLGSGEPVMVPWSQVRIWNQDGNLVLAKDDERKVQAILSYQNHDNTHVIEAMIRASFRNGHARLSQLLT
ncbi:hypothetical protein [Methylobacterium sp. J-067]|uniref:hypothetical protein n=1 Tax=Methylobacterium sp. J-067 TaxID=2836648 RepID=UPI001FB936D0|nr:hypothetical protein [Methylobacterium sp. J-067]MCJ2026460.1 hypothetical protein [Methylobacterium sp. J-067]